MNEQSVKTKKFLNDNILYGLELWESKNGLWKISQFIDKDNNLKISGWIMPCKNNTMNSQTYIYNSTHGLYTAKFLFDYPYQVPKYVKNALYKNFIMPNKNN